MTIYWLKKSYVFVVLELNTDDKDAVLHGVYTDREIAEGKRRALYYTAEAPGSTIGHVAVLKKPIQGKIKKSTVSEWLVGIAKKIGY